MSESAEPRPEELNLGEWLQDPVAMNIYLFALRDASLDSHGPWWPVIEAVGGLDAALQRLDALGTVLPEKPARMVRHTAVRLRHLIGSAGSHGEP